jgi:adenylate cyclase
LHRQLAEHGAGWALGLLAALAVLAASLTLPWQALEFKVFDLFTVLAAPHRSVVPVVILAIDEPSFQQLGQNWPFPRSLHARLLERLHADGAVAIGMDVVFADPSTETEDAALERAIATATPVVLASSREKVDSGNATLWTEVRPLQRLLDAGALAGDAIVEPDDDFVVRRFVGRPDSFALRLAQQLPSSRPPGVAPPDLLAYRGARGTFDTRSYYQAVLPGLLPDGFFKGKIVLVGRSALTATEFQRAQADLFNSPFGAFGGDRLFPGVELQATLLDNHLTGAGLYSVPPRWSVAWLALCVPLLAWAGRRWHPGPVAALAAALVGATALLSWLLFVHQSRWLAPLMPMVGVSAIYGASALLEFARARRRASQTRAMFAQYVPPEVVNRLIAQPELLRLGGETRELTLMFTDLANFTTLSEQQSAEQTVEVLTAYFNTMTPLIHRTGGTVDKFIGDAVMAFWGAPLDDARHAEHAVRAALSMQQAMNGLTAELQSRGLPAIHMRIGLHTGRVVVGNIGSDSRFSYTAIGDAVNLAARLEGANKAFGSLILLSEATASQLPDDIALRPLDDVIVKGKTAPIRVYTPCDDAALRSLSAQALNAFTARDWDTASMLLSQVLVRLPGDKAASRLLERLAEARALPSGAPWSPAVALDKL